jgi:NAD(P)H-dependent FMN reductase
MVNSATTAVAPVFNVVGFAGSLRSSSYNRALLRTAKDLAPLSLQIMIANWTGSRCTTTISKPLAPRRA